jgi:rhodanese-related sulfurtransferase
MVRTISCAELKAKIDRGDRFRLCMALSEWLYAACHIPGSILIPTTAVALSELRPDEEIVLYCSDHACFSSGAAAAALERAGYRRVWHFPGGLREWSEAGYPLEGTDIPRASQHS